MIFDGINSTMIFSVISIVYMLFFAVIFSLKKKIKTLELSLFKSLIASNIVSLFIECSLVILIVENSDLIYFDLKLYNCCIFTYIYLMTFYTFIVGHQIENQRISRKVWIAYIAMYIACILTMMILPVSLNNQRYMQYSFGPSVLFLFGSIAIMVVLMLIEILIKHKEMTKKKSVPIIALILLLSVNAFTQFLFPTLLLANSIISLVTFIMYYTVENPDVKMIQQLEIAKEAAEKANHAKTDFLSSMSHEIRTPLNAIVGFSDCIMETDNIEEAKENAKDIVNASQTLLEIVNGILDISKIEAGKLEISNSRYNALETFEELAKLITPKMNEKGLDFTYNIAPDLPNTLYGDHANLKKIVTNLLSNACKYTDKGYVHYEVKCVNTNNICKLIISVEDSGRGIKKENVDKLFTKFQRLDEDRNTTIEGTGLGLAITKQLIELMGGRIIVHTVYGEGSKFTVILNQKIDNGPVVEERKVKTTLDLENIRILMVDDTPLNLKVTTKLLEKYHANQVVTCNSGFECLDRIQRGEKYDIILLDDMMPKMSGVITLQKLKEIPGFHTPTIALTANAITGMREKYLADGFDDYLAKPIEKDQLVRVLNQILGRTPTEEIIIPDEKQESKEESPTELIPVVSLDIEEEKPQETGSKYLEEMGVDINHALELLGDMEMYNMTLHDFTNEVEEKWQRIKEYKDTSNMSDYAIEVHSLKSDCKYLGFMKLADISYQHELKSKENDIEYVQSHFQELEEEYLNVLKIAKKYEENNPTKDS